MFKVGDKVRIKSKSVGTWSFNEYCNEINNKLEGSITRIYGDGSGKDGNNCIIIDDWFFTSQDLELIQDNIDETQILKETINLTDTLTGQTTPCPKEKPVITKMQKLTNRLKRLFNPNQQIQYKAGYRDECGALTSAGRDALDLIMEIHFDDELTKSAEADIAEEIKDEK